MSEFFFILVLTLVNAFFAMSEIAVVQSSKPLLRQMAKGGSKRAKLALTMAEDTGHTLSTIQVGITLIGILAGAYGGANIAEKFALVLQDLPLVGPYANQVALACVVLLITYMSVVIGEIVPKQFALGHPEQLAIFAAYPLSLVAKIGAPVVWVLNKSAALGLALIGAKDTTNSNVTEDEVRAVLSEGAESGALEREEYDMMRRVIALGDRELKTIMTPRVDIVTLDINDDLDTIRHTIVESKHSRFPVIDGSLDSFKGIATARVILEHAVSEGNAFSLETIIEEPMWLSNNMPCHKVLEMFKNQPVSMVMVIDEYGSIEGIVTGADLLEAIVGSVASNYEDNEHNIAQREDGSWLVNGSTAVDELELTIGIEGIADNDHFTTLAGYILNHLGRPPQVGEYFEDLGYRFEIIDLDGRRIDKVLISAVPESDDDTNEDNEKTKPAESEATA